MRDNPYFGLLYVLVPFSLVSVGGGPAIFAPLQHQSVDIWHWVTAREFGWKVAGWSGAFVATLALFGPASIMTYAVARVYDRYRGRPWHTALEEGLAPIAVGLILSGAVSVLHLSGDRPLAWAAAIASGAALAFLPKLHPFIILFTGAAIFVAAFFMGLN